MQCFPWPRLLGEWFKSVDIELIICTFRDYTRDEFSADLTVHHCRFHTKSESEYCGFFGNDLKQFIVTQLCRFEKRHYSVVFQSYV